VGLPRWVPSEGPFGRWIVEFRQPRRKVKRFPVQGPSERDRETARKEAQRWTDAWTRGQTTLEVLGELGLSLPTPDVAEASSPRQTLERCAERFVRWLTDSQAAPFTIRAYSSTLRSIILPVLGDLPAADISPAAVDNLMAGLRRRGMSTEAPLACLSSLLSWLVEEGELDRNVCHRPRQRYRSASAQPRKPARTHTRPEREALLHALPVGPTRVAIVLAGWAGLRRREILGLRAEDVDLEQSIMRVRQQLQIHQGKPVVMPPKYQSARDVPIAPLLEAELRPWVERALRLGLPFLLGRVDYDGLPPTWSGGTHLRKDGTPVRQNSLDIDLAQASAAAGIDPPATLRTLRATAQTLWREAGLPGLQIEIWIGHSLRGMGGQAVGLTRVSADHYQGQVSGTVDRALLN